MHGADIAGAWPEARLEALAGLGHRRLLRDPQVIAATTACIQDSTCAPHAAPRRIAGV